MDLIFKNPTIFYRMTNNPMKLAVFGISYSSHLTSGLLGSGSSIHPCSNKDVKKDSTSSFRKEYFFRVLTFPLPFFSPSLLLLPALSAIQVLYWLALFVSTIAIVADVPALPSSFFPFFLKIWASQTINTFSDLPTLIDL